MTVEQISVFVENKAGTLAEVTKTFYENGIDMRALSIAEAHDFGILRAIVNDTYKAACVLKDAGYIFSITPVLAVEISDRPGSLYQVLELLHESEIDVEYTYAFVSRNKGTAYMIFRVHDNDKAKEILTRNNVRLLCRDDLAEL